MNTSRKIRTLGLATFAVLGSVGVATAQVVYTITDLGTLGNTRTKAIAMNNLGQVTGELYGNHRSFFWEAGVMIDIGTLGGSRCLAWGINNSGQVTGQTYDSSERWRAFVWDQTNGMTNLGVPAGFSRTVAFGINDAGEVVGYAYLHSWTQPHAVRWSEGHWTTLGTLGGSYSQAKAINNLSHVIGLAYLPGNTEQHSALWRDGEVIDLGTLGAKDINDSDQIVGKVNGHGALWQDFVITDLGTLGGAESRAIRLNNLGQVVGWARTAEWDKHAFIWENGVMIDLNERIPPASGWVLPGVADISDAGWIT